MQRGALGGMLRCVELSAGAEGFTSTEGLLDLGLTGCSLLGLKGRWRPQG